MRNGTVSRWKMVVMSVAAASVVAGCSPAVQLPQTDHTAAGTVQRIPTTWDTLAQAVAFGEQAGMYKEKILVQTSQGSLHTSLSVYGSVNPPNTASLGIHYGSINLKYYQQGLSAYAEDNLRWQQVAAIPNVDVFPSYSLLVKSAAQARVPIYKLNTKDVFVVDEYCETYQVAVPARLVPTLPLWGSEANTVKSSPVLYTFYVGKKDGQLREVTTDSVGAVANVGALRVDSDTVLFDIGNPVAQISIPKDLYATLIDQYQ